MKTLLKHNSNNFGSNNQVAFSKYNVATSDSFQNNWEKLPEFAFTKENLLTPDAIKQMALGQIPDLWNVCQELYQSFNVTDAPHSALQFIPALQSLIDLDPVQVNRFLKNPDTNHVLIQNDLLKVVLIHWKPGKISSIHGHPVGGCVFKVLQGQLEELRYTADESPKLLSSNTYMPGSMAYIDDNMGYHAVGNPFNTPAISLHAYTPGLKK